MWACRYILFQESRAERMPSPSEDAWPPTLIEDSPYGIISRKIVEYMMDEPAYRLYVSGHRCALCRAPASCTSVGRGAFSAGLPEPQWLHTMTLGTRGSRGWEAGSHGEVTLESHCDEGGNDWDGRARRRNPLLQAACPAISAMKGCQPQAGRVCGPFHNERGVKHMQPVL